MLFIFSHTLNEKQPNFRDSKLTI